MEKSALMESSIYILQYWFNKMIIFLIRLHFYLLNDSQSLRWVKIDFLNFLYLFEIYNFTITSPVSNN